MKRKSLSNYISLPDAKSKNVVSFRVIRGNVHDAKKFCHLVRESSKKYNIDKVYADKAHDKDNRRNFNLLDRLNVLPVIAIRNNASTRVRGCQLRNEEANLDPERQPKVHIWPSKTPCGSLLVKTDIDHRDLLCMIVFKSISVEALLLAVMLRTLSDIVYNQFN